jgi:hypothetical protein
MATYYYNPPELTEEGEPFPPLVLESNGNTKVVCAHKYWERFDDKYLIELEYDKFGKPVMDPKRNVQKGRYGIKSSYRLDAKRNAEMEAGKIGKPENFIDLTALDWACLTADRYRSFRPHLIAKEKIERDSRRSLEALRKAQYEENENERKLMEAEREELKRLRAERKALIQQEAAEVAAMKSSSRKSSKQAQE